MKSLLLFAHLLLLTTSFCTLAEGLVEGSQIQTDNSYPRVLLATNKGAITLELDRNRAPLHVNNFLSYVAAQEYDGTIFHRVIGDFVIQAGGYDIQFTARSEQAPIFNESGNGLKNDMYTLAMARGNDPHSAKRQWYINLSNNDSLNPGSRWGYTVFGVVIDGYEVVDTIGQVSTHYQSEYGFSDVPVEPVVIEKMTILPAEY